MQEQKKQDRKKRLVAGLVGGGLAVSALIGAGGAGTLALWSDSANLSGAQITTGNLQIKSVGDATWTDGNKTIDPATFRMVPSDTITGTQGLAIALDGDNLKANFALTTPNGAPVSDNFTVDYTVKNAATGATVASGQAGEGVAAVALPQTKEERAAANIPTTLTGVPQPTANYTVDMKVNFKESTPNREDVEKAMQTVTGMTASLTQVK